MDEISIYQILIAFITKIDDFIESIFNPKHLLHYFLSRGKHIDFKRYI